MFFQNIFPKQRSIYDLSFWCTFSQAAMGTALDMVPGCCQADFRGEPEEKLCLITFEEENWSSSSSRKG